MAKVTDVKNSGSDLAVLPVDSIKSPKISNGCNFNTDKPADCGFSLLDWYDAQQLEYLLSISGVTTPGISVIGNYIQQEVSDQYSHV